AGGGWGPARTPRPAGGIRPRVPADTAARGPGRRRARRAAGRARGRAPLPPRPAGAQRAARRRPAGGACRARAGGRGCHPGAVRGRKMTAEVIVMRRLGVHRFAVLVLGLATAVPSAVARHGHAPAPGRRPPLYADLGDHRHPVTTKSAAAQRYFDQGLRLVYAFNHDEAVRAFREAARLDPGCVMAWWGIAFASGPNSNMPI